MIHNHFFLASVRFYYLQNLPCQPDGVHFGSLSVHMHRNNLIKYLAFNLSKQILLLTKEMKICKNQFK